MKLETLLDAIGFTEASDFGEMCRGLKSDLPTCREEWRELFALIRKAESDGLVEVERINKDGREQIESIQLTEAGAASVRERKDAARPLLNSGVLNG